jgi:hypothetical protein
MSVVRLTIYEARWNGFARWRLSINQGGWSMEVASGWSWRGRRRRFEEWQWLTAHPETLVGFRGAVESSVAGAPIAAGQGVRVNQAGRVVPFGEQNFAEFLRGLD